MFYVLLPNKRILIMDREQFYELLRSMFSDEEGTLNNLNIRILKEDGKTALVHFDWSSDPVASSLKDLDLLIQKSIFDDMEEVEL